MLLKYIAFWLVLAILAVGNGILRGSTYGRHVPDLAAHQISTVTGILITGVAIWLFHRYEPTTSMQQAWLIGAIWLATTIVFEFGFGHFVAGHSWQRLFADYNLLTGRIWSLFLVWILVVVPLLHGMSRQ